MKGKNMKNLRIYGLGLITIALVICLLLVFNARTNGNRSSLATKAEQGKKQVLELLENYRKENLIVVPAVEKRLLELEDKLKEAVSNNDEAKVDSILKEARQYILNEAPRTPPETPSIQARRKPLLAKGKLLPPEHGAYVGTASYNDYSADLRKVRWFERMVGSKVLVDWVFTRIQHPKDGRLWGPDDPVDLSSQGNTLSVIDVLQARIKNGIVPAIEVFVPDPWSDVLDKEDFGCNIPPDKRIVVQDILDGKYDEYFMTYANRFKEFGHPILLEFLNEYNAWSWNLFGENGKTSSFDLAIQVYGSEGAKKIKQYIEQYGWPKNMSDIDPNFRPLEETEFYTSYGDPSVLDSAERVRDTWRHVHDLFDEVGVTNVTWFNHAIGSGFHGIPSHHMGDFWPGRNYVDWAGTSSYCKSENISVDRLENFQKTWKLEERISNLETYIGQWYREMQESEWSRVPLIAHEFSQVFPERGEEHMYEGGEDSDKWIAKNIGEILPNKFPKIKMFFLIPANFMHYKDILTEEFVSAFKKYVAENPYYQQELRFHPDNIAPGRINDLSITVEDKKVTLSWTAPGDDDMQGTVSEYIIKYRTEPVDNSGGIKKDFRNEPWRLWSRLETKDIKTLGVQPPNPEPAGTKQQVVIPNLSPGTYYFAIQSVDDVPYNSRISNVIEVEVK